MSKIAHISMPANKFKKMFGTNPQVGKYSVPKGAEGFMSSVKVIKIKGE